MEPKAPARSTTADSGTAGTTRAAAKAARREQLLSVAKNLYARHGFHGVRLDDLGKGAGISAPAVYRHFESKEAVLEELLVGISEYLNSGGDAIITRHENDAAASALIELIDFHVAFAMSEPELIRIQDRDLAALARGIDGALCVACREAMSVTGPRSWRGPIRTGRSMPRRCVCTRSSA